MSFPLLKRNLKQMVKPFLIFFGILSMYQGVIIYMYDPELMKTLDEYQKLMPELMAAVGMTGVTDTLIKFINTYLYGFLMQLFPFIFLLIIGNSLVMRYVDSGSLAVLLATPNSRRKIILTQAFTMIVETVLLIGVMTVTGILFAGNMFPGELDIGIFVKLNGSTLLLQLAVASIIFFAACVFNESRNFYLVAAGIPLLSFLMSMMANMGEKLEAFKYLSIYTLFPASKIVAEESGCLPYHIALAAITVVLFGGGIWYFCRKDFSL